MVSITSLKKYHLENVMLTLYFADFPVGPEAKTPRSQYRGSGFVPLLGN